MQHLFTVKALIQSGGKMMERQRYDGVPETSNGKQTLVYRHTAVRGEGSA